MILLLFLLILVWLPLRLLFGSETTGLSSEVLATIPPDHVLKLPMVAGSRSLNLSNAAAVALYEAWRQLDFKGAE